MVILLASDVTVECDDLVQILLLFAKKKKKSLINIGMTKQTMSCHVTSCSICEQNHLCKAYIRTNVYLVIYKDSCMTPQEQRNMCIFV